MISQNLGNRPWVLFIPERVTVARCQCLTSSNLSFSRSFLANTEWDRFNPEMYHYSCSFCFCQFWPIQSSVWTDLFFSPAPSILNFLPFASVNSLTVFFLHWKKTAKTQSFNRSLGALSMNNSLYDESAKTLRAMYEESPVRLVYPQRFLQWNPGLSGADSGFWS